MSDDNDQRPQVYEPPQGDGFDALHDAYERMLARVERLPEIDMRVAAIDEAIREQPPSEAAWFLDQVMRGALWGHSPAIDAMMAGALWLIRQRLDDDYDLLKSIFEAAHRDEREAVLAVLRDPPPHKELPEGKRLPEPDLPKGDEITLGERRQMARGNNRLFLERLLLDPSQVVVAQLLDNRHLTEQDVVLIGSRRPNTSDILQTVVLHKRWYVRREVRFTVVMNPYNATGISLKLLATLGIQKLRKVRNSTHLHPAVTEAAARLVELREQRTAPWHV